MGASNNDVDGEKGAKSDVRDFNFIDSLNYPLEDLNIPIIYGVDIAHMPPQLASVNGAYDIVDYHDGVGSIIQDFV